MASPEVDEKPAAGDVTPELRVTAVSDSYRGRAALSEVTFRAGVGVTGLLGPNGAGKTTLMRLISTQRRLTSGSITVCGHDAQRDTARVREHVGYLPQRFDVMAWASVQRNVEYAAWAGGLSHTEARKSAEAAIESVGLSDRRHDSARRLSGGMRQRLGIACAIAHHPHVLLLDEPTVGLDPEQRVALRELIAEIAKDAVVLVSTHVLEDLVALAGSVLVLDQGQVRFRGSMANLQDASSEPVQGLSPAEAGYRAVLRRAR